MIDLIDLEKLEICEKCKKVYMPNFIKGNDFAHTLIAVNKRFCKECETNE